MQISIIFDTNVLFDKNGSLFRCFGPNLLKLVNILKNKGLLENVKIFIPKIVTNELIKLKSVEFISFKENISKIKKLTKGFENSENFELILDSFLEISNQQYIENLENSYKNEFTINTVEINELEIPNKNCFDDILDRAFNKKIPFNPEHSSSDKGFKDTLILESILQNDEIKNSIVILYSNDKGFDGIEEEFNYIKLAKTIEIAKNSNNKYKTIEMVLEEVMNVK